MALVVRNHKKGAFTRDILDAEVSNSEHERRPKPDEDPAELIPVRVDRVMVATLLCSHAAGRTSSHRGFVVAEIMGPSPRRILGRTTLPGGLCPLLELTFASTEKPMNHFPREWRFLLPVAPG